MSLTGATSGVSTTFSFMETGCLVPLLGILPCANFACRSYGDANRLLQSQQRRREVFNIH